MTTKTISKTTEDNQTKTIIATQKPAIEDKSKTSLINSNRRQKGSEDPVAEYNRFDILKDILMVERWIWNLWIQ